MVYDVGRVEDGERLVQRRERGILGKANVVPRTVPLSVNVKSERLVFCEGRKRAGAEAPGEFAQKIGSNRLRTLRTGLAPAAAA